MADGREICADGYRWHIGRVSVPASWDIKEEKTMSDKTYNILKWIAQYLLPAVGTLYFALAGIWGLPYGEQVVGTITAVDTFLGVVLGISTARYNKAGGTL